MIESTLGADGFKAFCRGNAMKYIVRYDKKGGTESLRKAGWYLDRLIEMEEIDDES